MNKRFASLAISVLLLLSVFSVSALAEGPEAEAASTTPAVAELDPTTADDDHVVVTLAPEAALQPETPAEAAADSAFIDTAESETAKANPGTDDVTPETSAAAAETAAAAAEAKEDKQLTYVALGDSIVAGAGLADVQFIQMAGYTVDMAPNFTGYSPDCYVGKVASALGLDRDHAINLGLPALTAPDLVDMIHYNKMPQMNALSGCEYNYPDFQDYIRKADVISIQIGSNDAFVPCVAGLGSATNWKSEKLAATILSGDLRSFSFGSTVSTVLKGIKDMDLTKEESNAAWKMLTSDMSRICDETYPKTAEALIASVQAIRKLNPDVKIILIGYTDPVPFIPCWHRYFSKLNKFAKEMADIYDVTYVAIPNAETSLDVHPTIKGHQYIADKLVNAIENP